MREREGSIRDRTKVLTESLQNLVQLFDATSRPEKATEWKTKLTLVQAAGRSARSDWPPLSTNEQTTAAAP